MTDFWRLSALELGDLIANRQLTSEEVVLAFFDRIERINPKIGAYVTLCQQEALAEARQADRRLDEAGAPPNPLFGVPVSVKDVIDTRGVRTTYGSSFFKDHVPAADAALVERLRAAGCPILGKTNTPEFAGKYTTDNRIFGVTRNPWNLERSPGGSSGGAAAQVAAGLGPLAVGNDMGGSIRVPASCCGVVGLKPQFGRVPNWPKNPAWSNLQHDGPIARTVRDTAALLDLIAGPDERDLASLPESGICFLDACEWGVKGLRVAWSPDLGYGRVDPEVRAVCEDAVRVFDELGCHVEEAHLAWECPDQIFLTMVLPRVASWLESTLPEGFQERLDPAIAVYFPMVEQISSREVARAHWGPDEIWRTLGPFFQTYELLVTPTIAVPPYELGVPGPSEVDGEQVERFLMPFFTFPFNLTGQPAASIPAGFTGNGLPVGLQLVGRRHQEALVLRAAARYEEARPWKDLWPELALS